MICDLARATPDCCFGERRRQQLWSRESVRPADLGGKSPMTIIAKAILVKPVI